MRIAPPPRSKPPAENVIPMINVVFLLLVFFLITARIAPPLPVEVTAPKGEGRPFDSASDTLVIDAAGRAYFGELTDQAALDALATRSGESPLTLRADQALDAARLAEVLRIASAGSDAPIKLVVEN